MYIGASDRCGQVPVTIRAWIVRLFVFFFTRRHVLTTVATRRVCLYLGVFFSSLTTTQACALVSLLTAGVCLPCANPPLVFDIILLSMRPAPIRADGKPGKRAGCFALMRGVSTLSK
ncbi:unnamed protein product [Ectocarpus fasciculatus]